MKKKIYFITATNTDVGKTYASEKLLKKYVKMGKKVGYLKPIETGVQKYPLDGKKLFKVVKKLNKEYKNLSLDDIVPYQFNLPAAPFVASGGKKIKKDKIFQAIKYHFQYCDILIVEGAGGLMVPINKNYFMIDLIKDISKHYDTKTILITSSKLGSINDTLLSQKVLEQYGIKYRWYINLYKDKDSFKTVTEPFYKKYYKGYDFI